MRCTVAFLSFLCYASKRNFCSSPLAHFSDSISRAGFATAAVVVTELRRNPITPSLHCPALSPIILQLPHINQGADRTLDMLPSRNGVGGCSNRRVDFSPQTMLNRIRCSAGPSFHPTLSGQRFVTLYPGDDRQCALS